MKRALAALLICAAGLLAGCVGPEPAVSPSAVMQWPAAPLPARVLWQKAVHNQQDWGIAKGFWRRLADLVTGAEEPEFVRPYGVLSDGRGRLAVADTGAGVVHIMDIERGEHLLLGTAGGVKLRAPIGLASDDRGALYVTDSALGKVFRSDPPWQSLVPLATPRLERPTGIAYHPRNGLLYIADTTSHQVVAIDRDGQERQRFGFRGTTPGQFNYPTDLWIDRVGQIYITDALNARIQVLTPEGQLVTQFGESGDTAGFLAKPKGVAVDSDGQIYVVDALLDAVQVFAPSGELLLVIGGHGQDPGEFWLPSGIHIDANDTIYVADAYNRRIQVFRYLKQAAEPGSSRYGATGRGLVPKEKE